MQSQDEVVESKLNEVVFDLATGKLIGSLGGEEIESELEDVFDGEAFESVELESSVESDLESDLDSVGVVLSDRDALFRMAQMLRIDENTRSALNDKAVQTVRSRESITGALSNRMAHSIAARREVRKGASFEKSLATLEAVTKNATPQNFNPDNPESLKQAAEYFSTAKGRQDIESVKNAYQQVLKNGNSLLKGHRTADAHSSSNNYQEQVLKKMARYIDENESLLKNMKSEKDGDKNLLGDFKSGFDGVLDAAKAVFARLAVLLGAMNGARVANTEQRQSQSQESGGTMPLPQGYKPQMGPR